MDHIQPYLDYFALHPNWALGVIFLIAFGEALLVIGLVVPSTAVLVGAGALVGTGKLEFWPVIIATTLGCILGDQVSYWAGRIFGERLRTFWPLSAYPHLVAKGEEFMRTHGGKSIALGRFVPGVKAVIPGIAGMFGMGQGFFLAINVSSGIVWSFAHVLPGVLLGQALSLAGELSGRFLVILLVLLCILALGGWLIRLLSASITPYRNAIQGRISAWARKFNNRPMRRFARAIAPQNPRSVLVFLPILLSPLIFVVLGDIVSGRMLEHAVGNLDYSIFNLFSELRNAPADELFIRITMLGDDVVLLATLGAAVVWLLINRAWRAAVIVTLTAAVAKLVVLASNLFLGHRMPNGPQITEALQLPSFPSSHAVMAAVTFGCLGLMVSRGMGRWSRALVAASCSIVILAISFSRLYLGVNWMSDVIGGLLHAVVIFTFFSVAIATWPSRRVKPLGILLSSMTAFLVAATLHISAAYEVEEQRYAAVDKTVEYSLAEWTSTGWQSGQSHRVDLAGKAEEVFVAQWIGPLPVIQKVLEKAGYTIQPNWTWRDSFPYLDPNAALFKLPPRPALHQGLKAKLTAIDMAHADYTKRGTVRVFASNSVITGDAPSPIYLISLTDEVLRPHFHLFSVPNDLPISESKGAEFIAKLTEQSTVEVLGTKVLDGHSIVFLKPKL